MKNMLRALMVCCAIAGLAACSNLAEKELTGIWSGQDWGEVTFVDTKGTYASTFGPGPGRIELKKEKDGSYSGTWGEGTLRFGQIQLRFKDSNTLIGQWSADPKSEKKASDGGVIYWTRKTS